MYLYRRQHYSPSLAAPLGRRLGAAVVTAAVVVLGLFIGCLQLPFEAFFGLQLPFEAFFGLQRPFVLCLHRVVPGLAHLLHLYLGRSVCRGSAQQQLLQLRLRG